MNAAQREEAFKRLAKLVDPHDPQRVRFPRKDGATFRGIEFIEGRCLWLPLVDLPTASVMPTKDWLAYAKISNHVFSHPEDNPNPFNAPWPVVVCENGINYIADGNHRWLWLTLYEWPIYRCRYAPNLEEYYNASK